MLNILSQFRGSHHWAVMLQCIKLMHLSPKSCHTKSVRDVKVPTPLELKRSRGHRPLCCGLPVHHLCRRCCRHHYNHRNEYVTIAVNSLRWSHTHFICIPAVHIISFSVSFLSRVDELNKLASLQCMGLHSSAGRALQR